ncbi:membrane protein [Rufibacter glacialis]|nr:membrane protein [Rufibacter glacialis]
MADQFIYNPQLPTIREDWPGNRSRNGRFQNEFRQADHSMKLALRWKLTKNPQKEEKQQDDWLPEVKDPRPFLNSTQDGLVWLGHATFFIRLSGVTFLTDPVFYDVSFIKRKVPFPVPPQELPPLDYVLLSHGHFDHCDQESLKELHKTHAFSVLTSLNMGSLLQSWVPNAPIQEAGWYQQYQLPQDAPEVYFLPAYHWHKRGLLDNDRILWGSFMLQTPKHTLYFGADSGYDQHFQGIQQLFPRIDTCLLGIGAYSPAFIMQPSHTSPLEAVQAFKDLKGGSLVPMHYGVFDLSDEPFGEPLRWIKKLESQGAIPGKLKCLAIGEALTF